MKKILSVALSTAMAFSMFASVAFGAEANLTPQQKFDVLKEASILTGMPDGSSALDKTLTRAELAKIIVKSIGLEEVNATSYNDKNYSIHWARTFIEAATQAGILEGTDATKKLFNPSGNVTVQELAAVLVRALKLEVPADANNSASAWAKGYVQAAVDAGFIDASANFTANATRSQAVVAAYAIYDAANFKVTKAEAVDATHVKLTLSTGEVVDVTLTTPLVANKATDLEYTTADGKVLKYTVTWVVTDATKVVSVSASNLKEVVVAFDGEVDAATAQDANNYTVTGRTVTGASLSSDKKTVTLTVDPAMSNQTEYKLSFNNVKAGANVLSASDYKFTPVDAALPTVTSAEALGNKTIKVTFSEPVKVANASSFLVDGKAIIGYTTVSGNSVIVKLYSALDNGEHTLTVSGVEDFHVFKSLSSEHKFTVVEDVTAPTVASIVSATFEKVTVKFSEVVDPATVSGANVYWLEGTSKKYAAVNVTKVSDDTFTFDFSGNRILYTTDLYINGVKDYTGNQIAADTKVSVTPVVDTTRPEVVNVTLDNRSKITVKFSKALTKASAEAVGNYVIKDADGNEYSKLKTVTQSTTDAKVVVINLATALKENAKYTLTISGVVDTTTLHNALIPYTKELTTSDSTPPEFSSIHKNSTTNQIVVTFTELMAVTGDGAIVDLAKYQFLKTGAGQTWSTIPSSTNVNVTADGKSVILTFNPSDLDVDDIAEFRIQLVKDAAGNYLKNLSHTVNTPISGATAVTFNSAEASATNTIKVNVGSALLASTVNAADFTVTVGNAANAVVLPVVKAELSSSDSKVVVLTLADGYTLGQDAKSGTTDVYVNVRANATTSTAAGVPVASGTKIVSDSIAATVDSITATAAGVITINFNEDLEGFVNADATEEKTDLTVSGPNGTVTGYTLSAAGKVLTITLPGPVTAGVYSVTIAPRFLTDDNGNKVASAELQVEVPVVVVP